MELRKKYISFDNTKPIFMVKTASTFKSTKKIINSNIALLCLKLNPLKAISAPKTTNK